jgi:uridylate kinase
MIDSDSLIFLPKNISISSHGVYSWESPENSHRRNGTWNIINNLDSVNLQNMFSTSHKLWERWHGSKIGGAVKPLPVIQDSFLSSALRSKREYVVVSVGGSLIVPDEIDTTFLSNFRELILKKIGDGLSFFIITGGGKTARRYQEAAHIIRGDLDREDLDWLGIHSTRLNAHLMRSVFSEQAQARIVKNPTRRVGDRSNVIIGAGWKPGWSTDYCAVLAAKKLGAKKLVNLSNIDFVYDKDPKKFPEAVKIERSSWADFRKLIPDHWDPGLSSPFDPIAAKEAEAIGLEVAVINGKKLDEFEKYLSGQAFSGTIIK